MRSGILKIGGAVLALAAPLSQASAERLFGLTETNQIITFDSMAPLVTLTTNTITGIAPGDTLVGLDLRPATRSLYTIGTSGRVYSLVKTAAGYTATTVGTTSPTPAGLKFGIDFNPVPDRIRLVSDANQNLRINPATAVTLTDVPVTLNGSSTVDLVAAAYTNSRPGVTTTTLYALDSISDRLVRSTNPNGGLYTNTNIDGTLFGPLGVRFSNVNSVSFDISGATGAAFFSIGRRLFSLDLSSGAATYLDNIGDGPLHGLTAGAIPEPASWALMIAGFGLVGTAMRRRAPRTTVTA